MLLGLPMDVHDLLARDPYGVECAVQYLAETECLLGNCKNDLQTCVLEMSEQGSEIHFARRHASKAF